MLLQSRADHEFAQKLNTNLRNIAEELKKYNSNKGDFQNLYNIVKNIAALPVPDDVSVEYNRVLADCQNLYESLSQAKNELHLI